MLVALCVQAVAAGQTFPESVLAATELSNPVQALMAILGNESTPPKSSLPPSATIRHMLSHIVHLCTGAFACSPTAISTTIKPLTHLALASQLPKTPFPPAAGIWVPASHSLGTSHITLKVLRMAHAPVPQLALVNSIACDLHVAPSWQNHLSTHSVSVFCIGTHITC